MFGPAVGPVVGVSSDGSSDNVGLGVVQSPIVLQKRHSIRTYPDDQTQIRPRLLFGFGIEHYRWRYGN